MIRWLLIALFIYLLYKLIRGSRSGDKNQRSGFIFRGNPNRNGKKRKNLDHIEEAEFEDITPKEKKNR